MPTKALQHLGTVLAGMCFALLLTGCSASRPASTKVRPPDTAPRTSASVTQGVLVLTVSIPRREFTSGSTETATTTLTNSSDATVTTPDDVRVAIRDSKRKVVWQNIPPYAKMWVISRLAPHTPEIGRLTFVVPPPGSYTVDATLRPGDFSPAATVPFVSIP